MKTFWNILTYGFPIVLIIGVIADIQHTRGFEAGKITERQHLARVSLNPLPSGNGYIDSVCMGWLYGADK